MTDEAQDTGGPDPGLERPRAFPAWLEERLVPDARFARAYNAFGDDARALFKRLIAAHFALNPPVESLALSRRTLLRSGLAESVRSAPRSFAVILCDAGLDAPAFLLAALVPALCAGVPEILVVRLGAARGLSHATLAACELAGQERVAALGQAQVEALLAHCAQAGLPGLLLYADTAPVRRILARPGLEGLHACRLVARQGLTPPQRAGLWRDAPADFPAETVALAYGGLAFELGGILPGESGGRRPRRPLSADFDAFATARRDLLLAPDARMARLNQEAGQEAGVCVARSQLGLWTWAELANEAFHHSATAFGSRL